MGVILADEWAIEVNVGADEIVKSFALHVRGGDAAIGAVATILDRLKLRALTENGSFFVPGLQALESFHAWRRYRDQVIPHSH